MNRRKLIALTEEEIQPFLQSARALQVATIDHDGYPHLVTMWYILDRGRVAFWTYARSQKALNLRRDPRLTCLVEDGERYEELRGVQIKGRALIYDDFATVESVGLRIFERYTGPPSVEVRQLVHAQATKRIAIIVEPEKLASWDHRKLGGVY